MKCPNCDQEMDNKTYCKMEGFYHWEDEEIYYQKVEHEKFVCKSCKITYLDGEWKIPKKIIQQKNRKRQYYSSTITWAWIFNLLRNINVG